MLATRAPAKVNLTLHVLGRRPDGYHALESLVAFAGTGDDLSLKPGALSLSVSGPTANAAGGEADNLVLKAARALARRVPGLQHGRLPSDEAPAGRGRPRRRLGGRRRGAAAPRPPQRPCASTIRRSWRRRGTPAPTCRCAFNRAPA